MGDATTLQELIQELKDICRQTLRTDTHFTVKEGNFDEATHVVTYPLGKGFRKALQKVVDGLDPDPTTPVGMLLGKAEEYHINIQVKDMPDEDNQLGLLICGSASGPPTPMLEALIHHLDNPHYATTLQDVGSQKEEFDSPEGSDAEEEEPLNQDE